MQIALHQLDLLLLFDDDALGKTPQNWIAAVDQFELGHVDRALVMRNHHRGEIAIRIARRLCGYQCTRRPSHIREMPRCRAVLSGIHISEWRDRTAWLGRKDSNLRMAESKSSYFT